MAEAPKNKKKELTPEEKAQKMADAEAQTQALVEKAQVAFNEFKTFSQEQVDKIVAAMALAGSENSLLLGSRSTR